MLELSCLDCFCHRQDRVLLSNNCSAQSWKLTSILSKLCSVYANGYQHLKITGLHVKILTCTFC